MSEYIEMTESEFAEFINEFDREELIDAQTELQKDTELSKTIRGKFIFLVGEKIRELNAVKKTAQKNEPILVFCVCHNTSPQGRLCEYKMFVTRRDMGEFTLECLAQHRLASVLSHYKVSEAHYKELIEANIVEV